MYIDFKQLKYLFIDFDGTLVDSVPLLYDNYIQFLKKFNRIGTREEFISLMGPTIEEFIPVLASLHQLEQSHDILTKQYTEGLSERYAQEVKLMRGAQEFLNYATHHHLKLYLVTSSPFELIEKSLDLLKLHTHFELFVTGEKVKKTKPDPEIYLYALKKAGAKPSEVLAIEDSDKGVQSAVNAGLSTVLIHREIDSEIPTDIMIVRNWRDLLKLFKRAYGS